MLLDSAREVNRIARVERAVGAAKDVNKSALAQLTPDELFGARTQATLFDNRPHADVTIANDRFSTLHAVDRYDVRVRRLCDAKLLHTFLQLLKFQFDRFDFCIELFIRYTHVRS